MKGKNGQLPLKTLDEAYETKDAVAVAVRTSLQRDMKSYGYEVLNALVTDLQPNSKVVGAMNQINAERRLRLAAEEKAEGQKVLVIKAAEADAESKHVSTAIESCSAALTFFSDRCSEGGFVCMTDF